MPASAEELKKIAVLRLRMQRTDAQIAQELGVAPSTISKWARSPEYMQMVEELRRTWREQAKQRVASLAEDALTTLHDLMLYAKSEKVRLEAAATILETLGISEDAETKHDDRDELVEVLKQISAAPAPAQTIVFLPPGPGGTLPSNWAPPQLPNVIDVKASEVPLQKGEGREKEESVVHEQGDP